MGKNKLAGRLTKAEKNFIKLEKKYEDGTLSSRELNRISQEKQKEYLKRELNKKYKTDQLTFSCLDCAKKVMYLDSGNITDDDLLEHATTFKHM